MIENIINFFKKLFVNEQEQPKPAPVLLVEQPKKARKPRVKKSKE